MVSQRPKFSLALKIIIISSSVVLSVLRLLAVCCKTERGHNALIQVNSLMMKRQRTLVSTWLRLTIFLVILMLDMFVRILMIGFLLYLLSLMAFILEKTLRKIFMVLAFIETNKGVGISTQITFTHERN